MVDTAEKLYTGYKVTVPEFEGPLDLLLYLVKNYEINIYDIPITLITEQFMSYLRLMKRLDLEIASEFIVMAAHLMLIKSKMLLPEDPDLEEDDEDPRSDLVEQLLEYQKFKEAASRLEESELIGREVLERKQTQVLFDLGDDKENWVDVRLFDLVNAFSRLLSKDEKAPPVFPVLEDEEENYDPNEKMESIQALVKLKGEVHFYELLGEQIRRGEIIITFLAVLHLIKAGTIVVKQHKVFGDIKIFYRELPSREFDDETIETGV